MRAAGIALAVSLALVACRSDERAPPAAAKPAGAAPDAARHSALPDDPYVADRERMVARTIEARGIRDRALLDAMRAVPRHELVPHDVRDSAYEDRALPIGFGLTISQPFIVASMTAAANVKRGDRVLEIGTGSGYQAAVLAEMGAEVYTIEIVPHLAERTRQVLAVLGYDKRIQLRVADGYFGWTEAKPFDAIIVTAAAPLVPPPLLAQLKDGGRLVIPVGDDAEQKLQVITKEHLGTTTIQLFDVRFGPMTGEVRRIIE